MKRWLWLFPLLLLTAPAIWAAPSIFTIPDTDQSRLFLMQIFGRVGGILSGSQSGNPLKDALFYFNNIILVVGGLVILYSTIVSTVNTAHDGEVLGKKWNSVWIPIRSALGFALLLPLAGGYSIIQGLVMWVVLQGVGGADYIWTKYADGVAAGSYLTTNNNAFNGAGGPNIGQPTNQIFNNLVCANSGQLILTGSTDNNVIQPTDTSYNFSIPQMPPSGNCGSVARVANPDVNAAMLSYIRQVNTTAARPYAQRQNAINNAAPDSPPPANNYPDDAKIKSALQAAAWQYNADISRLATAAAVETGGNAAYKSYLAQFKQQANSNGWIYAGALYLLILNIQNQSPEETTKEGKQSAKDLVDTASPDVTPYDTNINIGPQDSALFAAILKSASTLTDNLDYASSQPDVTKPGETKVKIFRCAPLNSPTRAKPVLKDLVWACDQVLYGWSHITDASWVVNKSMGNMTGKPGAANYTPLINLAQWGQNTINTIMKVWLMILAAIVVGSIGNAVLSIFAGSLAVVLATTMVALIAYLTPIMALIMAVYWVNGSIAGYYLPMLPFLIFSLTAAGWLILVVEAMVAAPLMALGILHPEGRHDIVGSSEAGFQILVGVFLRPMLMIVGFIAAGLVVTVVIQLVNGGFYVAMLNLFSNGKLVSLWGSLVLLLMYVTTLFTLINRAFSLIYHIPDKILRWIGLSGEQTSTEDLSAIRQGTEKTAQQGQTTMRDLGSATSTAKSAVEDAISSKKQQ